MKALPWNVSVWAILCVCISLVAKPARIEPSHDEELRVQIADLQYALHAARVDIAILEERIAKLEKQETHHPEAKKSQEECRESQTRTLKLIEEKLEAQEKKFQEIAKLKHAISALATTSEKKAPIHRVQAGETLEKIARAHHITVDAIKEANHLKTTTIYVGQELELPDAR